MTLIDINTIKAGLHTALCLALMWSCFYRQARSTARTRESVRMAFVVLFAAALLLAIAPWAHILWPGAFAPRYAITWPVLAVLAAIVYVQAITARYWRRGAPANFHQPEHQA